MEWCGSGWVQVESSCEFGDEHSGSIKCWLGYYRVASQLVTPRVVLSSIQFDIATVVRAETSRDAFRYVTTGRTLISAKQRQLQPRQ
jgi:hypothetical protein